MTSVCAATRKSAIKFHHKLSIDQGVVWGETTPLALYDFYNKFLMSASGKLVGMCPSMEVLSNPQSLKNPEQKKQTGCISGGSKEPEAKGRAEPRPQPQTPTTKPPNPNHQTLTTKPQPPNPNHQTTKPPNPNHQTPTTKPPNPNHKTPTTKPQPPNALLQSSLALCPTP